MRLFRNAVEAFFMVLALAIFCLAVTLIWPESKYGMAAWVQAIGSVAALVASFSFFYAQRKAEIIRGEADLVLTKTKSVMAVMSLSRRAILAMELGTEQMYGQHAVGIIPFSPDYFDDLSALFGQFITPEGDFIAVQHALEFRQMLMEAKYDFSAACDDDLRLYVIERSKERISTATEFDQILREHQYELLDACRKYGMNPIAGPLKPLTNV